MRVRYTCLPCGIFRVEVDVPPRGDDEDVVHWVSQTLAARIGDDHAHRSPHCSAIKMTEVEIPMQPGQDSIGKPTKN